MALEAIVADKRLAVAARMRERPLSQFVAELAPSDRSLRDALSRPHTGFVLECKKASPSQGSIRDDFDPVAIAKSYAPFADAISVLTDEPYFQGSLAHLAAVRQHATQPVLCKDFVVDSYQIHEARAHGADAILLMCSVLDQAGLEHGLRTARSLSMDALVEVHDAGELERALDAGADIIGVNNRNLKTLQIDLTTTGQLAPRIPRDKIVVCESGIATHAEVQALAPMVDAFLVGTSLMREPALDDAVRRLLFGRVKICGLRTRDDARAAHRAGATFGGVVLWPRSPRAVTTEEARLLCQSVPLHWVGVFVDAAPNDIATAARALDLHAVQLHGDESADDIAALRALLPDVAIWKAQRVGPRRSLDALGADRLLLDAYRHDAQGGTGRRFDWDVARAHPLLSELVLSGGITPDNAVDAMALGCWALDLSSGVERAPGEKDAGRIDALLSALRGKGKATA